MSERWEEDWQSVAGLTPRGQVDDQTPTRWSLLVTLHYGGNEQGNGVSLDWQGGSVGV